jgi:GNAT acetyltransferase-like protein
MDLERTSNIDEAEYVRFLDSFGAAPGTALAYHYPFYLRFLTEVAYAGSTLRFYVARENGSIAGVLPSIELRTDHLHVSLSLAYFGPNGGAIVPADRPNRAAIVCALTHAAAADARERGCGSMTVYTPLAEAVDPYVDALGGVDFRVPRFSQWLTVADDPAASPWPAKVRYYVRRAASRGVVARTMANEGELDVVYEMYRDRCLLRGIPVKPRHHLSALFQSSGDRGVFLVAEHDRRIIGGLICFVGGGVISYFLPIAHPDARALRPALLLLDTAVAIGRAAGCRRLNFEASPSVEHSVFRFKSECGGRPVAYEVLVKLMRPGVLDEYRALTPAVLAREAPQAFVVPFNALTSAPVVA